MKRATFYGLILAVGLVSSRAFADGPADNVPDNVRRVPALGVEVSEADQKELSQQLDALKAAIDELAKKKDARTAELLPDVQIFYQAVHDALKYREFFKPEEVGVGKRLAKEGLERANQLKEGNAPWTTQTGLVVRGYVSKIDGSVQPYGLVVPDNYLPAGEKKHRLDIWFHGRGEVLSEVNFIAGRQRDRGVFTPPETIVLHPYGRYCNANKLAGEIDTLEAMESVQRRYRIDEDRIAVRGFSMGGAACWQFAVHYADRWVGATPGAGFSETPDFLKVFQKETLQPTWYEKKLWHMYDCTDWAVNLFHCPTVAYSGENDNQKQAADMMAKALADHGVELVHIIGPKTGHSYHPEARVEIERRLNSIAAKGRERLPREVRFVTYTLRYNRMHWVTVDGMDEHWEAAGVHARLMDDGAISMRTYGVTELTLSIPPGYAPFDLAQPVSVDIDDQDVRGPRTGSDRSWNFTLHREGKKWVAGPSIAEGLRKRHELQGPIDDAFMDSFVFVRPSGKCAHDAVDKWVHAEFDHAVTHWRSQFRGHAREKSDGEISDADIASSNLVLWGDPQSNAVLKRIADKLPIKWGEREISVGDKRFPAENHAAILIYPNPLNPKKYVVLNSSFTYREYDYLNNARQVPKLPDWAIVDVRTPPNSRFPGKIAAADFFGEKWEVRSGSREAKVEVPEALSKYLAREEPAFKWELRGKESIAGNTVYDLHLVSQDWQGIVWEHQLQVYQPPNAKPAGTMVLWNQGGKASAGSMAFGIELASKTGTPVAFLYGVPNQPLFEGKKEDALIAETFVRYLESKDERWPLLFPMVKSVVKAMDALQAFAKQEWQQPVEKFIVTGASKRGWTTWLTGASDPRVKAIAPLVIDTLNMREQGPYQLKSFGKYSDQIHDYTERGLLPMPDSEEARKLWSMVDPWVYRDRLTMPKLILNGVNDPYWTTDALNLYWDDLPGDKWVTYVPNAGHNLEQNFADGQKSRHRAVNSLAAFARHQIKDNPMPKVRWKHDDAGGKARLVVEGSVAPKGARLWVAEALTRDFRLVEWKEQAASLNDKTVTAEIAPPATGCRAFFAELDFEVDGLTHQVSTQLRIVGEPK